MNNYRTRAQGFNRVNYKRCSSSYSRNSEKTLATRNAETSCITLHKTPDKILATKSNSIQQKCIHQWSDSMKSISFFVKSFKLMQPNAFKSIKNHWNQWKCNSNLIHHLLINWFICDWMRWRETCTTQTAMITKFIVDLFIILVI